MLTKDEILKHGASYHEHRCYITQHIDLLNIYLKELDTVLEDIEKRHQRSLATELITRKYLNNKNKHGMAYLYINYTISCLVLQ